MKTTRIDNDVLAVLDRAEKNGCRLVITEQLDRKMYVRVNAAVEAAGGKWNRGAKAHVFDGDAAAAIEDVMLTGEIVRPQDLGFFETPAAVVARLLDLARPAAGMQVLEPSAGRGAIARDVRALVDRVDSIEIDERHIPALDDLRAGFVTMADFLTVEPVKGYDLVVMNPPFARQADIRHVTHAHRFLRPGGRLVSVMSAGAAFRGNRLTVDFRRLVAENGGMIEALPDGSFKPSGTMVNTVIVAMNAPERAA